MRGVRSPPRPPCARAEPGFCLGFPLPRRVPLPAPGPRVRLTLQNDLLERLPLQSVPAPQFFRDVTLPAGKVCGAEGRRHAERFPGASGRPLRADTGGCRLQRAASHERTEAGCRNLTSSHRAPLRLSGRIFSGPCRKLFWRRPENPPRCRRSEVARKLAAGDVAGRSQMTQSSSRKYR